MALTKQEQQAIQTAMSPQQQQDFAAMPPDEQKQVADAIMAAGPGAGVRETSGPHPAQGVASPFSLSGIESELSPSNIMSGLESGEHDIYAGLQLAGHEMLGAGKRLITPGGIPGLVEGWMHEHPSQPAAAAAKPKPAPPVPPGETLQAQIDKYLQPYIGELGQLGPEYQKEMNYLQPYLQGTPYGPQTFQGLQQWSAAQASPTGNKAVASAVGNLASAAENEPTPGFGGLAKAAEQYAGTVPYQNVLQTVLQAGKNEILGYSTIPNLSYVSTQTWPKQLQGIIPYLESNIGVNPSSGLATSSLLQNYAQQAAGNPNPNNPQNQQPPQNPQITSSGSSPSYNQSQG